MKFGCAFPNLSSTVTVNLTVVPATTLLGRACPFYNKAFPWDTAGLGAPIPI